ncbi:uncharacterized protein LOC143301901 isoform X2 [Babylonia areolata]
MGSTCCLSGCDVWVKNLGRDDFLIEETRPTYDQLYNNFRLCGEHFEDAQFTTAERKRLVWNAVPTLFRLPHRPCPGTGRRPSPQDRSEPLAKKTKSPEDKTEQPSHQEASPSLQQLPSTQEEELERGAKRWQNKAGHSRTEIVWKAK